MTNWQYSVLIALIRIVIDLVRHTDVHVRPADMQLLYDALERTDKRQ